MTATTIALIVKCKTTNADLYEVVVRGHQSVYRDRAYKMFGETLREQLGHVPKCLMWAMYDLVYKGYYEVDGQDRNYIDTSKYTFVVQH